MLKTEMEYIQKVAGDFGSTVDADVYRHGETHRHYEKLVFKQEQAETEKEKDNIQKEMNTHVQSLNDKQLQIEEMIKNKIQEVCIEFFQRGWDARGNTLPKEKENESC
jgi:hypothetical protein